MKKVLLLAALALGFVGANAQSLSAKGTIKGTDKGDALYIEFTNSASDPYAAMQFDVYLPEGYSFYTTSTGNIPLTAGQALIETEQKYKDENEEDMNMIIEKAIRPDGALRIVVFSLKNQPIENGTLLSFKLLNDGTYKAGDVVIKEAILAGSEAETKGGSGLKLEPITVTGVPVKITTQFATLASPFAITLPEGVKAYSGSINDKYLDLTGESSSVEAGKPVFLAGTPVAQTFFGMATATTSSNGVIEGVYEDTPISSGYVLSNGKLQNVSSSATVPAYKAYLNTTSEIKGFRFADDATAIEGVNGEAAGAKAIYGVNGAARSSMVKGINIVKNADGSVSKVLVK